MAGGIPRLVRRHRRASIASGLMLGLAAIVMLGLHVAQQRRRERSVIQVSCSQPGAPLRVERWDPESWGFADAGNPGATPADLQLAPGLYWLTVTTSAGAWGEQLRFLPAAGEFPPSQIRLLPKTARPEGMRLVPEGDYQLGQPGSASTGRRPRTVHLAAFFIDEHEVSHRQYRAYVLATGVEDRPAGWSEAPDPALDERPVVGITYELAEAYAAWLGQRLPTQDEAQAANPDASDAWTYPAGQPAATLGFRCARSAAPRIAGRM